MKGQEVEIVVLVTTPNRRAAAAFLAAALAAGLFAGLAPVAGRASSHREAPLIAADPQADNTDVYAFVSPDEPDTVTLIGSWIPFEEPAGGPNFYPWATHAAYDFRIDNDGDARADVIYRWTFRDHRREPGTFLFNTGPVTSLDDPDLNFFQTYDLRRIDVGGRTRLLVDDAVAVPSYVGAASMPDYEALFEAGVEPLRGGGETWVGQSDDPFFLDLRVFDLLYGADLSEVGDDTLAGFNVNTIALRVPKEDLAAGGDPEANPIVGIWSTTSRRATRVLLGDGDQAQRGRYVQVSRLGMPLVNEVVIPAGMKDRFNASRPADDGRFLSFVTDPEVPKLIEAIYGIPAPATPRDDLVAVFLTGIEGLNQPEGVTPAEMLRLNMSIPPCASGCSRLGVIGGDLAGFPNGRRLTDDVIDIALQVVEGELVGSPNDLGDGVDANDVPFRGAFPYVALPHAGSDASPH
ncbi:MAG TPA: DUF4331 domain-containing protein [Actinomycetota bacterium]|nr:DUF4331 domain-containing protein [Actinomycetota bacterium]